MKKLISFFIICVICFTVQAQIPQTSLNIINRHYPTHSITHYEYTNKLFIVKLSNNTILKFKKNGDLVEVIGYVPTLLIPYQINNHLMWHYPHRPIQHYYKHNKGYYLKFKNGRHVRYNKRYKLKNKTR